MANALWTKKIPEKDLDEFKTELEQLKRYMSVGRNKPDAKLDTALLGTYPRVASTDETRRAFRGMMVGLSAARRAGDKSSETFLFAAISRWLRKNLELTSDDVAFLLELVASTADKKQWGSFLGASLSAIKRAFGGDVLAKSERKSLKLLAKQLDKSEIPQLPTARFRDENLKLARIGISRISRPTIPDSFYQYRESIALHQRPVVY